MDFTFPKITFHINFNAKTIILTILAFCVLVGVFYYSVSIIRTKEGFAVMAN
jgi:hypothetical protein